MKVHIPPIKSQGIKTKLVPWIEKVIPEDFTGLWVEPFMGTGVVGFNLAPQNALLCDTNPHLINFYQAIADNKITPEIVRDFLNKEGCLLLEKGESHYYAIRQRFNQTQQPLDFLFLNRAGFNGMIRFNRKGEFNIPFCRKPQRFAQAYVTKIVNQMAYVSQLLKLKNFQFKCQTFETTLATVEKDAIVYCDPPYIARHADYYNSWNNNNEKSLYQHLKTLPNPFILSTWHHNDFRHNEYINTYWHHFNILTREHFYHVGAKEKNRNSITEAIVTNFECAVAMPQKRKQPEQLALFNNQMACVAH